MNWFFKSPWYVACITWTSKISLLGQVFPCWRFSILFRAIALKQILKSSSHISCSRLAPNFPSTISKEGASHPVVSHQYQCHATIYVSVFHVVPSFQTLNLRFYTHFPSLRVCYCFSLYSKVPEGLPFHEAFRIYFISAHLYSRHGCWASYHDENPEGEICVERPKDIAFLPFCLGCRLWADWGIRTDMSPRKGQYIAQADGEIIGGEQYIESIKVIQSARAVFSFKQPAWSMALLGSSESRAGSPAW
jgi:hypothetical protein